MTKSFTYPRWSVAQSRREFARLLGAVAGEPQTIYRRNRPVAVVVEPDAFAHMQQAHHRRVGGSLADAFDQLRQLCADEAVDLDLTVARADRPNPWPDVLDELAGGDPR